MAIITENKRIKVYSEASDKGEQGFSTPPIVALSGARGLSNVAGSYSEVLVEYALNPSALPSGSLVLGDVNRHVYQLKPSGIYTVDPESDTYNGFGESTNWIDITVREHINTSLQNKTPLRWNADIAPSLAHPVMVIGSDNELYQSVSGGNLEIDPTLGVTSAWQLFLDTSKGIIPVGFLGSWPTAVAPNGWVVGDGRLLPKADFADLYDVLCEGGGSCIYGETATDFYLPDYRGLFNRFISSSAGLSDQVSLGTFGSGAIPMAGVSPDWDTAAAGTSYVATFAAGVNYIELPSVAGLEEGMLVSGTGITPGTYITEIQYQTHTTGGGFSGAGTVTNIGIGISLATATPAAAVTLTFTSRWDRGDGTTGRAPGTIQRPANMKHFHNIDVHRHNVSSIRSDLQGTSSGGLTALSNVDGSARQTSYTDLGAHPSGTGNESRPPNIYTVPIIKF